MKRVLVINDPVECPMRAINDKGFPYCTVSGSLCHCEFPEDCCLKFAPIVENTTCPYKKTQCVDLSNCEYQHSSLIFHCDILKKNGKCPLVDDNSVIIDCTPNYDFKEGMLFLFKQDVDYDGWEMYNVECDIHIFNDTKEECIEELEEELETFAQLYNTIDHKMISEGSLKLFEKLKKYVDLEQMWRKMDAKKL